jgi:large subunit ribosomal protein L13
MDSLSYKTIFANNETANKGWVVVDAETAVVGRLAANVARVLRGKHKTNYTPNVDCGDNVIIINADKVRFTGKKWDDKEYIRHTGHPGGQRFTTPRELKAKSSTLILEKAVRGMLPKKQIGKRAFQESFCI